MGWTHSFAPTVARDELEHLAGARQGAYRERHHPVQPHGEEAPPAVRRGRGRCRPPGEAPTPRPVQALPDEATGPAVGLRV